MRWSGADDEILGTAPVVLVTISTPGGVIRVSSQPVSVPDADGAGPYHYVGGVLGAVDVDGSMDLLRMEGTTSLRQVSIDAVLPEGDDATALEAGWWAFAAARVEVALLWDGMRWADRDILLGNGIVSGPVVLGTDGQPSRFTVEAQEPASAWAVDPSRDMAGDGYPTVDYGDLSGYHWPLVLGRVYGIPVVKGGVIAGPAYRGLICGHHFAPDVTTGDFAFYTGGGSVSPTALAVSNVSDPTGQVGSVTGTTAFGSSDPKVFADCSGGGVAAARNPQRAAVGAADVVEWLLFTSGVRVDWRRMTPTLALLQGWEIGLYLDDTASCLEALRECVAPHLPIVEIAGPDGLWYRYVEPWTAPIRASLVFGQELVGRLGGLVLSDPSECRNAFVVSYAFDHYTDDYTDAVVVDDTNYELCRYSRQLFGVRAASPVKCPITWDEATARRMAMFQAVRSALPRRQPSYLLDSSLYWLEEGDFVEVTDATWGLTSARAYVAKMSRARRPIALSLEVFDRAPVSTVLG